MRLYLRLAALVLVTVCLVALFASCGRADEAASDGETDINYSDVDISEYIGTVTYKGLEVALDGENASKEDALWGAILDNAEIKAYPEDKVRYYFEQEKASYMYLVNNDEDAYGTFLKVRGITEEDMLRDAKEMVAKDLIWRLIAENEGITLTDEEKETLFDRYVEKYVKDYGYGKTYVTANMPDIIYESMLYDKTMEYLILNNNFEVK